MVIPRNHSTAQLLSQMNRRTHQANAAANNASNQANAPDNALGEALNDLQRHSNHAAYRLLNSHPSLMTVLLLEMWNVNAEWHAWNQTEKEKGYVRAGVGQGAAARDLLIAMAALTLTFRLADTQSALAAAKQPVFNVSPAIGRALSIPLVESASSRLLLQTTSSLVFFGLNLYDAWYAWQWHDQAMYGYLLMAGGALASAAASWITAATFLGLTPLGWIALLAVCIGAGTVYGLILASASVKTWKPGQNPGFWINQLTTPGLKVDSASESPAAVDLYGAS